MKDEIEKLIKESEVIWNAATEVVKEIKLLTAEVPSIDVLKKLELQRNLITSIGATAMAALLPTITMLTELRAEQYPQYVRSVDEAMHKLDQAGKDLIDAGNSILSYAQQTQSLLTATPPHGASVRRDH